MLFNLKLLSFLSLLLSFNIFANINVVKPLSFGKIAIADNSVVSRVVVSKHGQISTTNNIYVVEAGSPAELEISGYAPGTSLNLVVTISNPTMAAVGIDAVFTLTATDSDPTINIGSSGVEIIRIGGTIESSGDSKTYFDSNYYTSVLVDINF